MESVRKYILKQLMENKLSRDAAKDMLLDMARNSGKQEDDIAIIGISGKFPKAKDLEEFWSNIDNMVNCIDIPSIKRRKPMESLYEKFLGITHISDESYEPGGYMDDIDKFDENFFGISNKEAVLMEPLQRILLETVYLAIEDAGIAKDSIYGSNTAVFIGRDHACESSYSKAVGNIHPLVLTGSYAAVLASRISHVFNFTGQSVVMDTACSSGLVSVHNACKVLKNGECEMAIAGGINIKENLLVNDNNPMDRILTKENAVRTFDKNAKGTLLGEGVGVVLLKPLRRAIADGDNIHAVIKGSAVNNDGASNRVATPKAETQEEVLAKAWEDANIDPETISYIEAHGTGTLLGDPIEIKAIKNAFERYTPKKQFCAICTAKTNIGHTVAASGMASLLKAVMALKYKKIPGIINFKEVNPYINFPDSPVYVNDASREWKTGEKPRRCGINSFGFSGTNCHVILEEAPKIQPNTKPNIPSPLVFTVSAKTLPALRELIKRYNYFFENNIHDIHDLCYTSQTGRGHYEYRMAFVVRTLSDLKARISMVNSMDLESINDSHIYYGEHRVVKNYKENKGDKEYTQNEIQELTDKAYEKMVKMPAGDGWEEWIHDICRLYVTGAAVEWSLLYMESNHLRVTLPVYPLERKSCWFDFKGTGAQENKIRQAKERRKLKGKTRESLPDTMKKVKMTGRDNGEFSSTETVVAQAWAQILNLEEINIHDNYFELGGDSVRGIKIINLLRGNSDFQADITELLMYASIYEFAEHLDKKQKDGLEKLSQYDRIKPVDNREYYPLSSAQKRLFIINQLEGGIAYNLPRIMMVDGIIDRQKLEDIFNTIVQRQESLRTSFELIHGEPIQRIHKDVKLEIDCVESEKSRLGDEIKAFIREFDLSKPPLMRVRLVRLAETQHVLMIDVHHIIADRSSIGILIKEFVELYEERTLPKLNIQYRDFAIWQNGLLDLDMMKKQEKYWLSVFSGNIPSLELPTDYKREIATSFEEDIINFDFTPELTTKINSFASKNNVTLNMVLLAVYNILLWKWTGQEDIVVGLSMLGRQQADLEHLIGMFVNTLAVRNYPRGNKTFLELMKEIKDNLLNAYANQDYPFERLVDKLGMQGDKKKNPLFNTMFIMQNINYPQIKVKDLSFSSCDFEVTDSRFDIQLDAFEGDGVIHLSLLYCKGLFKRETMEKLLERYTNIIVQIIESPEIQLRDIEKSNQEKTEILLDFNDPL